MKDGDSIFFVDLYTKSLYRHDPLGGSPPVALITGNSTEGWTHTNATHAFIGFGDGSVKMIPKTGGAITTLALGAGAFMRGADATSIYYDVGNQLWRRAIAGSSPAELVATGVTLPDRVVASDGAAYFIDTSTGTGSARILRVSTSAPPTFGIAGLYAPYGPPDQKQFRSGRTIPLKWQITESGQVIDSSTYVASISVIGPAACGETGGNVVTVETSGGSGYQYDAATKTWQFNWNTASSMEGCFTVLLDQPQLGLSASFPIRLAR